MIKIGKKNEKKKERKERNFKASERTEGQTVILINKEIAKVG